MTSRRRWDQNQWCLFWSYSDEKSALQIFQALTDAARMAENTCSYQSAKSSVITSFEQLGVGKPDVGADGIRIDIDERETRWLFSEGAHDSFRLLRMSLAAETTRDLVITAIALKRYEIRHQHLPGTLQELVPDFVKTVPIDWMDGQPLRYRPNSDGTFLLYSVGENGKDDGGNTSLEKHDRGHVWFLLGGPVCS